MKLLQNLVDFVGNVLDVGFPDHALLRDDPQLLLDLVVLSYVSRLTVAVSSL